MTQAQEQEFRRFLEGVEWHGTLLTEKGIDARVARVKKVEEILNTDIETIVSTDTNMRDALLKLRPDDVRGNRANAVRKYYEMRNGVEFPPLREAPAVVGDSGASKHPKSKSESGHSQRHVLVYVCQKGESGLDSFTADGLIIFADGYGDHDHSGLKGRFGAPIDNFFYDCGEDAPYRYAYYECNNWQSPWIPVELLLKRGCRSIIIDLRLGEPHGMPDDFRVSIPRLLREHGHFIVVPSAGPRR